MPEPFLDVDGGRFHDVRRRSLHGGVHRLALGLSEREGEDAVVERFCSGLFVFAHSLGVTSAHVGFGVRAAAADPREEPPAAHQGLNVAVLGAVLHRLSEEVVDS